jgi:DNA-binding CsgD family transcriptional regulator
MVTVRKSPMPSLQALQDLGLKGLIEALGTPRFAANLVQLAQGLIQIRHLAIFAFDDHLLPHVVVSESIGRSPIARTAGRIYEQSFFYRHDPNLRTLPTKAQGNESLLLRLRAREIADPEYRARIYDRFGLVDRLTILCYAGGHWLAINFYRERRAGEFRDSDIERIQNVAGLIASLAAKHFEILPPPTWHSARRPSVDALENLVSRVDSRLTQRQIQVCARALMGMTSVAVGLDLGIQVPTVATLRKRAYAVLQISSLNELFALCLGQTARVTQQTQSGNRSKQSR